MSFGSTLHKLRMQRGLSQAELARRTRSEHSSISRLESGSRNPSRVMVMSVAMALNATDEQRDDLLMLAGFAPVDLLGYVTRSIPEIVELVTLLDGMSGLERELVLDNIRELTETVREHLEAA